MTRLSAAERAQRKWGDSLGPPPPWLNAGARWAWGEIAEVTPPLRYWDQVWLPVAAQMLADWRQGGRGLDFLREVYRWLGLGRIPMRERRRLVFPDRPRRR